MPDNFRVYIDGDIEDKVFRVKRQAIVDEINSKTEEYILNVNVNELTDYFEQKYKIEIPTIHLDQKSVDSYEDWVKAELYPGDFNVQAGEKYKRRIIRYHIPFSGDINILRYKPSKTYVMLGGFELSISYNNVIVSVIDFYGNPDNIKNGFEGQMNHLLPNYQYLQNECREFNSSLKSYIEASIFQRKNNINEKYSLLTSLGVPLNKNKNVPQTFSIPNPELRKK